VDRALTARLAAVTCAALAACGVARPGREAPPVRPFSFARDTFAFANDSHWLYVDDPRTGARVWTQVDPPPTFALHCAGVVRSARQFLVQARFDPGAPRADAPTYLALVREVLGRDPRTLAPDGRVVVIPGYADLRSFSADFDWMLKDELLRDWRSVLPKEDWRIIIPTTPAGQVAVARRLAKDVRAGLPAIVRVLRFPDIVINHAVLVYEATDAGRELRFRAYDPNDASAPVTFTFDVRGRTFVFPPRAYFDGGPVKMYRLYDGCRS
jgi:hypothetical protein